MRAGIRRRVAAMAARLRGRPEAGVTLVELLVAITLLSAVMAGLALLLTTALDLNRQNVAGVVAANLADAELDIARDTSFAELSTQIVDPPAAKTVDVGAYEYTVTRQHAWTTLGITGGTCNAPQGGSVTHLEVQVVVESPALRGPHRSQTVIVPWAGDLAPDQCEHPCRQLCRTARS